MAADRRTDEDNALPAGTDSESGFDLHRPHPARMYDYYLGGATHFAADREAAEQALSVFPVGRAAARAHRTFMHRAIRALAASGITQFLDVGIGTPLSPNVHEVAQGVDPRARIVYVDNDPFILDRARALLNGAPEGRTGCVEADVRDPDGLLEAVRSTGVLDFSRPIALSLIGLLHFFPDGAHEITERFRDSLTVPGSALAITHFTGDFAPQEAARLIHAYRAVGSSAVGRTGEEFGRFFTGWRLLEPGVVSTARWRPDPPPAAQFTDAEASCLAAVAVRP